MDGLPVITTKCVSAAQQRVARRRSQLTTTDTVADCASRKFGAAQGSKVFFQMNRKGRWACGPCSTLVHKIQAGSASPSTFAVHFEEYLRPLGCSEFSGGTICDGVSSCQLRTTPRYTLLGRTYAFCRYHGQTIHDPVR